MYYEYQVGLNMNRKPIIFFPWQETASSWNWMHLLEIKIYLQPQSISWKWNSSLNSRHLWTWAGYFGRDFWDRFLGGGQREIGENGNGGRWVNPFLWQDYLQYAPFLYIMIQCYTWWSDAYKWKGLYNSYSVLYFPPFSWGVSVFVMCNMFQLCLEVCSYRSWMILMIQDVGTWTIVFIPWVAQRSPSKWPWTWLIHRVDPNNLHLWWSSS